VTSSRNSRNPNRAVSSSSRKNSLSLSLSLSLSRARTPVGRCIFRPRRTLTTVLFQKQIYSVSVSSGAAAVTANLFRKPAFVRVLRSRACAGSSNFCLPLFFLHETSLLASSDVRDTPEAITYTGRCSK